MSGMEFKDCVSPTGKQIEHSEQFRMIISSTEIESARVALNAVAIAAMQTGGLSADLAEGTLELLQSLSDWRPTRYTTVEQARQFAHLLEQGGISLLDDMQSSTALRMAHELRDEATIREQMAQWRDVQPYDFL